MASPETHSLPAPDLDDSIIPCKGCGEILEEGKAFELAGNRWHIDCFRCNTCGVLLDSDANLLLLGDGSLICNNCTYSCSACGNKIEDLAILTGEQAFCSGCFRCRNCKRKIENLRYARTTQGIFCMACHESLMTRRKKKARTTRASQNAANGSSVAAAAADKSLPALPPNDTRDTGDALPTSVAESALTAPVTPITLDAPTAAAAAVPPPLPPPPATATSTVSTASTTPLAATPTDHSPPLLSTLTPRNASLKNSKKRDVSPASTLDRQVGSNAHSAHPPRSDFHPILLPDLAAAFSSDLALDFEKSHQAPLLATRDRKSETHSSSLDGGTPRSVAESARLAADHHVNHSHSHNSTGTGTSSGTTTTATAPSTNGKNINPSRLPLVGPRHESLSNYQKESSRSSSVDRDAAGTALASKNSSPHIASQDKGRQHSHDSVDSAKKRRERDGRGLAMHKQTLHSDAGGNDGHTYLNVSTHNDEAFKLQDAPRPKKTSPAIERATSDERETFLDASSSPRSWSGRGFGSGSGSEQTLSQPSPRPDLDNTRLEKSASPLTIKQTLPRSDSIPRSVPDSAPASGSNRKFSLSSNSSSATGRTPAMENSLSPSSFPSSRTISRPIESPSSRSLFDVPVTLASPAGKSPASKYTDANGAAAVESFTSPRAPPPVPHAHRASESVSSLQSEATKVNVNALTPRQSPALPRHSAGGELSMDEEMVRIMRGDEGHESSSSSSVLRRVSNAVSKHGRSFSDRGSRSSTPQKWKPPATNGVIEITSPTTAMLSDPKEEVIMLRNQLRRAQQRIAEIEAEKHGLQDRVNGSENIKQMTNELDEKRSTVAFLDTQREVVVRELEVMTEHLARAKDTTQQLDYEELKSDTLKDFATSLQSLKDELSSQIEDLIQQKNELTDEISTLIQMKDKGFQEYESLSTKNTQLTDFNTQLIQAIQDNMLKAGRTTNGHSIDGGRPSANALGIYSHSHSQNHGHIIKERLGPGGEGSVDLRSIASSEPSSSSAPMQAHLQEHDSDGHAVLNAPEMVNLRKGQPKKFNWKKGAKNVTKGFNRAFASNAQYSSGRDAQHTPTDTGPYISSPVLTDYSNGLTAQRAGMTDGTRPTFGFFGQNRSASKIQSVKGLQSNSSTNLTASDPTILFGSELHLRCDLERRCIPSIVSRCIEEVELRGIDAEGIYRKSGGSTQVKVIQSGFEKDLDYDISDPDLDIHAVTSTLKQYLRKLPTPLITFEVYDQLIEATQFGEAEKILQGIKEALGELPRSHHDCLEFLVFHLARVIAHEKSNLMTSLNLAVVFAPTIMRPVSVEQEMQDMQAQRTVVQSILENNKSIFVVD